MLSMRGLADSPTFIQNTEQADLQTFPSILQVNRRDTSFPFAPSSVPFHASIDDNERVLLKVLMMIGSGLSIIGSFFIILSYFLFKDSRKFSRKILLYLSFADMVASSAWVLQYVVPESAGGTGGGVPANNTRTRTLCETQGYMLEFFYLASYIWTGCFAWHLYQLIDARNRTPRKLEGWYHALSWGIPLIICGYLYFRQRRHMSSMGPATDRPWCWIESAQSDSDQWMQFAFFYGPLLAVFSFNLCIYLWLCSRVRRLMSPLQHKIKRRLMLYLSVFIILTFPGFANRIWQAADPDHTPNFILLCADSLCGPLQGFGNAIVYGLNKRLRQRYYRLCCNCSRNEYYTVEASEALRQGAEYRSIDAPRQNDARYGSV